MRSLPASHAALASSTAAGPVSRCSAWPFAVSVTPPPVSFASISNGTRPRTAIVGSPVVATSVQRVPSCSSVPCHANRPPLSGATSKRGIAMTVASPPSGGRHASFASTIRIAPASVTGTAAAAPLPASAPAETPASASCQLPRPSGSVSSRRSRPSISIPSATTRRDTSSGQVATPPRTTAARASSGLDAPGGLAIATSFATTARRGQNAMVTGPRASTRRPVTRETSSAA